MSRNYTISTKIKRPVHEVFDAVVSHDRLSRYFTDRSSGDLAPGERIIWHWEAWGEHPVTVKVVDANRRIELMIDSGEWHKTTDDAYDVRVILEFEATEDGHTLLSIGEEGWRTDAEGLTGSHDNCGGWMHMAMCLKGYLEHGIDLR